MIMVAVSLLCEHFRWLEDEGRFQADVEERRHEPLPCHEGFK